MSLLAGLNSVLSACVSLYSSHRLQMLKVVKRRVVWQTVFALLFHLVALRRSDAPAAQVGHILPDLRLNTGGTQIQEGK